MWTETLPEPVSCHQGATTRCRCIVGAPAGRSGARSLTPPTSVWKERGSSGVKGVQDVESGDSAQTCRSYGRCGSDGVPGGKRPRGSRAAATSRRWADLLYFLDVFDGVVVNPDTVDYLLDDNDDPAGTARSSGLETRADHHHRSTRGRRSGAAACRRRRRRPGHRGRTDSARAAADDRLGPTDARQQHQEAGGRARAPWPVRPRPYAAKR